GCRTTYISLARKEAMKHTKPLWMAVGFAVLVGFIGAAPGLAQNEIFVPLLVFRTGPYAPNGIPIFNGYSDYLKLLNARDGGINGVKITWEECETQYDTNLGV